MGTHMKRRQMYNKITTSTPLTHGENVYWNYKWNEIVKTCPQLGFQSTFKKKRLVILGLLKILHPKIWNQKRKNQKK